MAAGVVIGTIEDFAQESAIVIRRIMRLWGVMTIGTGLGNARFSNRGYGKQ